MFTFINMSKPVIKKAVFIGLNHDDNASAKYNCARLAKDMEELLRKKYNIEEFRVLVDDEDAMAPTKENILKVLNWSTESVKNSNVLWYCSSFGVRTNNGSGRDEELRPVDYRESGLISSIDLHNIASRFPAGTKVRAFFPNSRWSNYMNLPHIFSDKTPKAVTEADALYKFHYDHIKKHYTDLYYREAHDKNMKHNKKLKELNEKKMSKKEKKELAEKKKRASSRGSDKYEFRPTEKAALKKFDERAEKEANALKDKYLEDSKKAAEQSGIIIDHKTTKGKQDSLADIKVICVKSENEDDKDYRFCDDAVARTILDVLNDKPDVQLSELLHTVSKNLSEKDRKETVQVHSGRKGGENEQFLF